MWNVLTPISVRWCRNNLIIVKVEDLKVLKSIEKGNREKNALASNFFVVDFGGA